jgi:hypothetical protein
MVRIRNTHQKMEHGEELARRHEHMVTEPTDVISRIYLQVMLRYSPGDD